MGGFLGLGRGPIVLPMRKNATGMRLKQEEKCKLHMGSGLHRLPVMNSSVRSESIQAHLQGTMKALVLFSPAKVALADKTIPRPSHGEALMKITTTTICGTDVPVLKRGSSVKSGLIPGQPLEEKR